MLLAIDGNAFTNNEAAIVDGFRDSQDLEGAFRKIAQEVEIVHLGVHEKERMLAAVIEGRGADDHSSRVLPRTGDAVG
jgi:hypothetical protein